MEDKPGVRSKVSYKRFKDITLEEIVVEVENEKMFTS